MNVLLMLMLMLMLLMMLMCEDAKAEGDEGEMLIQPPGAGRP